MRFLFLTRTYWNEPPRIRHQLARLLASNGHEVLFVEKPGFLSRTRFHDEIEHGVSTASTGELAHHQLRAFPFIRRANAKFVRRQFLLFLKRLNPDVVINFNYDYGDLRSSAPQLPFVTILNDDFIAAAKPWMKRQAAFSVRQVCKTSDLTLCVSYSILEQASEFGGRTKLLLPWCDTDYSQPDVGLHRTVALYFGYINHRVDWCVVREIAASGRKMRFVGPFERAADRKEFERARSCGDIEYLSPRPLADVPLDDVCCSILPYKSMKRSVQACTVSNRAFQLLARGIPLVYVALPRLISAPADVIVTAENACEYVSHIENFGISFDKCQDAIAEFLKSHTAVTRYHEFMRAIHGISKDIDARMGRVERRHIEQV